MGRDSGIVVGSVWGVAVLVLVARAAAPEEELVSFEAVACGFDTDTSLTSSLGLVAPPTASCVVVTEDRIVSKSVVASFSASISTSFSACLSEKSAHIAK